MKELKVSINVSKAEDNWSDYDFDNSEAGSAHRQQR